MHEQHAHEQIYEELDGVKFVSRSGHEAKRDKRVFSLEKEPIVFLVRNFGTRQRIRSSFVQDYTYRTAKQTRQLTTKSQYRTSSVARRRIILKSLWFELPSTTTTTRRRSPSQVGQLEIETINWGSQWPTYDRHSTFVTFFILRLRLPLFLLRFLSSTLFSLFPFFPRIAQC